MTEEQLAQWESEWPDRPLGWYDSEARVRLLEVIQPAMQRVGWFNPYNDYHGFQQVHRSAEGAEGTFPLFCRGSDLAKTELPAHAMPSTGEPIKQQGNWIRVTEPCGHPNCDFPACDCEWDPIPSVSRPNLGDEAK